MIIFQNIFKTLMYIQPILQLSTLKDVATFGKLNCTESNNKTFIHFPKIRVSSFDSPSVNNSESQLYNFPVTVPIALRYLELECKASYPVIWGFAGQYPYIPWDTDTERKSTLNSSKEEFLSTLTFYSLRVFDLEHRFPTCFSTRDKCLQTTLASIRRFSTPNETVQLNFQEGLGLPIEPKQFLRNNLNCTIKLGYDERTERFYCHTTTGEIPEIIFRSCSNTVTCNALMTPTNCSIEPEISIEDCTEEKSCRIASLIVDYLPAVATCVSSGKDMNSAYIQYFYSFPIRNNSYTKKFRYFKLDDAPPEDMLKISHLESSDIYSGENFNISCNASYYYFSSGLKIRIEGESFLEDFLNADEVIKIQSSKKGNLLPLNRSALLTDSLWKPGKYQITCSAPVWNSSAWISKPMNITILTSEKPKIFGGNATDFIDYKPNMTVVCKASGIPKPILNWLWNRNQIISDLLMDYRVSNGGNESYSWSKLHFPNLEDDILENITCVATNCIGNDTKDYHLISKDSENKDPIIFAVIIVSVISVVVVAVLVWKIVTIRGNRVLTKAEWKEFMYGKIQYVETSLVNSEKTAAHLNDISEYYPYDTNLEIERGDLLIDRGNVLGKGAYGVVWKAELKDRNISSGETYRTFNEINESKKDVAVKTLRKDSPFDGKNFKALLYELKILSFIKSHKHIVKLIGAFTKNIMKGKVYIVLELCENGSLLEHIKGNRIYNVYESGKTFGYETIEFMDPAMIIPLTKAQTFSRLMTWALQITDAMKYLASIKIVHGDLALRNILLSKHWEVKITDFGLSDKLNEYNSYFDTPKTPLPLKWLAIECLQIFKCYLESDIWSFGITLWEILSLGEVPYTGMEIESLSPQEFLRELQMGIRPKQPPLATPQIYEIMKSCWHEDRNRRPSFTSLNNKILQCLEQANELKNSEEQESSGDERHYTIYSEIRMDGDRCPTNNDILCTCVNQVDHNISQYITNITNCSKL